MKEKIKGFLTKKNIIICACSLLALIIIIVGIIFLIPREKNNEKLLNQELEKVGRYYYENYYYVSAANSDELSKKADYLSNFTNTGLKISLSNLLRYNNTLSDDVKNKTEFKNSETNEACDMDKSMVTIYPKEPFTKGDYQISIYLDCGFQNEE
jgi:hypothetical protein